MSFKELGLKPELQVALAFKGYADPTPIQKSAIPAILSGRDVLGGAQTGTGKTAAFVLPILQYLTSYRCREKNPRALIITPTRELAQQIEQFVIDYGAELRLRSSVVFGGVGINPQIQAISKGLDILIATPGRLIDLVLQRKLNLSAVEVLVLDEADRMLDMGFIHDIKKILRVLPGHRQNLLFSATYTKSVKAFAEKILRNPVFCEVSSENAIADTVSQRVFPVGKGRKVKLLAHLITTQKWSKVLIFTRTKWGADHLTRDLGKEGIKAMAIHGDKGQTARYEALDNFKRDALKVLVATDIASRGLDIDNLPYVVNYDLPTVPEDYIHRIGRTGRAGENGLAVSLVAHEDRRNLDTIKRELSLDIKEIIVEEFYDGPAPKDGEEKKEKAPQHRPKRFANKTKGNLDKGSTQKTRGVNTGKAVSPSKSSKTKSKKTTKRDHLPTRSASNGDSPQKTVKKKTTAKGKKGSLTRGRASAVRGHNDKGFNHKGSKGNKSRGKGRK